MYFELKSIADLIEIKWEENDMEGVQVRSILNLNICVYSQALPQYKILPQSDRMVLPINQY